MNGEGDIRRRFRGPLRRASDALVIALAAGAAAAQPAPLSDLPVPPHGRICFVSETTVLGDVGQDTARAAELAVRQAVVEGLAARFAASAPPQVIDADPAGVCSAGGLDLRAQLRIDRPRDSLSIILKAQDARIVVSEGSLDEQMYRRAQAAAPATIRDTGADDWRAVTLWAIRRDGQELATRFAARLQPAGADAR